MSSDCGTPPGPTKVPSRPAASLSLICCGSSASRSMAAAASAGGTVAASHCRRSTAPSVPAVPPAVSVAGFARIMRVREGQPGPDGTCPAPRALDGARWQLGGNVAALGLIPLLCSLPPPGWAAGPPGARPGARQGAGRPAPSRTSRAAPAPARHLPADRGITLRPAWRDPGTGGGPAECDAGGRARVRSCGPPAGGRATARRIVPRRPGLARPRRAASRGRLMSRRPGDFLAVAAVPPGCFGAGGSGLAVHVPGADGGACFPWPVVTCRLPGPVASQPEPARTRMGESADALEEP